MKKIRTVLIISILILSQKVEAQITQLEFALGMAKTDFTSFSIRPINESKTFTLSTLAFFQKYHEKDDLVFDELGVQANAFWNFNKSIAIGPSLYYNSVAGFSERLSLMISKKTERITFSAIPSIAHLQTTDFINGELFIQVQFTQPIKKHLGVVLSALILTHWDKFSYHSRSFQQVRTGLYHKTTQFGLALDFDQHGKKPLTRTSIGLFVRKTFIDNQK